MRRNDDRARGFTLLEVLIAFIIAALALSALFAGSLDGLLAVQAATGYEQAVARARSHLAAESIALAPGDREGDDGGGFRWRARVRAAETWQRKPSESEVALPGSSVPPVAVTLYAIEVGIAWSAGGHTREVRLATERLGAVQRTIR